MNKYELALKDIDTEEPKDRIGDLKLLNELIERNKVKIAFDYECPTCHQLILVPRNFCPHCGQRLKF